MTCPGRWVVAGALGLAMGLWFLAPASRSADDDKKDDKEMREAVLKLAGVIEKKDAEETKKQAAALAKRFQGKKPEFDMEDLMHLLHMRTKKNMRGNLGLGVGAKPMEISPDGIEKKVDDLGEKALTGKQMEDEAKALEEMGYRMVAVAEIALLAPPIEKDTGKKKVKDWNKWSLEMRDTALQFAEAAKKKEPATLHKVAEKASKNCFTCHDIFRFSQD